MIEPPAPWWLEFVGMAVSSLVAGGFVLALVYGAAWWRDKKNQKGN